MLYRCLFPCELLYPLKSLFDKRISEFLIRQNFLYPFGNTLNAIWVYIVSRITADLRHARQV